MSGSETELEEVGDAIGRSVEVGGEGSLSQTRLESPSRSQYCLEWSHI